MTDRPHPSTADHPAPPSAAEIRRRLAGELALPSRLGHTLLLLAGLGAAGVTGALLLTEPALPARTRVAFAVMVVVGLAWAALAAWVLARRRVLLATHRVAAARLAIAATALFTAGAAAVATTDDGARGGWAAAGVGAAMLGAALLLHRQARRRVAALARRRDELARELAARGGRS